MTGQEARPCRLPESAPPCVGCRCGAPERRATGQEARQDGREALARVLGEELGWDWEAVPEERIPGSAEILLDLADAILAAGYRKQPEPDWEYGASVHLVDDGVDIEMHTLPWDDRDQAAQVVADGNADQGPEEPLVIQYVLVKRTAAIRAGEWVPVEEGEQ